MNVLTYYSCSSQVWEFDGDSLLTSLLPQLSFNQASVGKKSISCMCCCLLFWSSPRRDSSIANYNNCTSASENEKELCEDSMQALESFFAKVSRGFFFLL